MTLAAESVKGTAEDAFVEELVLAEEIQRAVGDRGTGQNEVVPAGLAEPVQRFGAFGLRILDLAAFVADDHVGFPSGDLCFQSPAAFVVDHDHRQTEAVHVPNSVDFLVTVTIQHRDGKWECRKLIELLLPDLHDGFRGHDQQSFDVAGVIQRSRHCDGGDGFASAHVHEVGASFTLHRCHRLPSAPWPRTCEAVYALCPS